MDGKPLLKEIITEQLRSQILRLQTDAYVKIASERELAETLEVSRISLRAAVKTLVEEGLLVREQGRGTYIRPKQKAAQSLHLLFSPDIKPIDPFYNQFLIELTNASAAHSIELSMIHPDREIPGSPSEPLVVVGLVDHGLLRELASAYPAVVLLQGGSTGAMDGEADRLIRISFDDYRIGREAAQRLLAQQHRRLIHLAGPDKYPSASNRKRGFMEAAREAEAHAVTVTEKMNWSGGYKAGELVAERLAGPDPATAVFAANDWMAAGLIQKLKERGIRIPEQVAVIGCDDIPLACELSPSITTFRLDMRQLVTELFTVLNDLQGEGSIDGRSILLHAALIQRQSG